MDEWTTVTSRRSRRGRYRSPERYAGPTSTYRGRDVSRNHRGDLAGEGDERSARRARAPEMRRHAPRSPDRRRTPSRHRRRTYASVTRTGLPIHDRASPRRYESRQDLRDPSLHRRVKRAPDAETRRRPDAYSASQDRTHGHNADYRPEPPRRVDVIYRGDSPSRVHHDYGRRISPRRADVRENSWRRAAPTRQRREPQRRDARSRLNFTRRGTWNDRQRTTGSRPAQRQDERPMSDDPDFARKCHVLFRIIKAFHHFSNVSTDKIPVSINRMINQLTTLIKPAIPTPQTLDLILGNAKNWAHTTLVILCDHYEQIIKKEIDELYNLGTPEWQAPFQIASTWAKRHFGRRLTPETLTETEEIITEQLIQLRAQSAPPAPLDSAPRDYTTTDPPRQDLGLSTAAAPTLTTALVHAPTTDGSPLSLHTPTHTPVPSTREEECTARTRPLSAARSELSLSVIEDTPEENLPMMTPFRTLPLPQRTFGRVPTGPGNTAQPTLPPRRTLTLGNGCVTHDAGSIQGLSPTHHTTQPEEETRVMESRPPIAGPTIPTPSVTDTLQTAVQSTLTTAVATAPLFTPQPAGLFRPSRHMTSARKIKDWHLNMYRKWVIMGDSNVHRLPPHTITDLQIDSFPGANFRNAEGILDNTTESIPVEVIIMSFGICNREQKAKETSIKQLQSMLRVAKQYFPQAKVLIPQINFSNSLSAKEKNSLTYLNSYIALLGEYIPMLPSALFKTDSDNVHWTQETAQAIFDHWCTYLN